MIYTLRLYGAQVVLLLWFSVCLPFVFEEGRLLLGFVSRQDLVWPKWVLNSLFSQGGPATLGPLVSAFRALGYSHMPPLLLLLVLETGSC